MRFRAVAAAALACACAGAPAVAPASRGTVAESDALARAAGNRRAQAIRLAESLFGRIWPAQILKVRIDGEGAHEVAGLVISGVKFHHSLDERAFTEEAIALVEQTFRASGVEEVDVWTTIPLAVAAHEVVAGDLAVPTSRIVYAVTVLRDERPGFAARLRRGNGVYWDAGWKTSLARR